MKTLAEKIAIMQAAERGELVQIRPRSLRNGEWQDTEQASLRWNWVAADYRVKPKEPLEFYIVVDNHGYVCGSHSDNLADAEQCAADVGAKVIKMREVIEE